MSPKPAWAESPRRLFDRTTEFIHRPFSAYRDGLGDGENRLARLHGRLSPSPWSSPQDHVGGICAGVSDLLRFGIDLSAQAEPAWLPPVDRRGSPTAVSVMAHFAPANYSRRRFALGVTEEPNALKSMQFLRVSPVPKHQSICAALHIGRLPSSFGAAAFDAEGPDAEGRPEHHQRGRDRRVGRAVRDAKRVAAYPQRGGSGITQRVPS